MSRLRFFRTSLLPVAFLLAACLQPSFAQTLSLDGPWRFRVGDDPAWSKPEHDDSTWDTLAVGQYWEKASHPGYDGFAWYRRSFVLPAQWSAVDTLWLTLGTIDDADETYVNGRPVGRTGSFPPGFVSGWSSMRAYPVPTRLLRPGAPNVVAVRVYDERLDGGMASGPYHLSRQGGLAFEPFTWPSAPPRPNPFPPSADITGIRFTGRYATYTGADTWYPSWASDGHQYSPWTDGSVDSLTSQSGWQDPATATTGQARIEGDDPMHLRVVPLPLVRGSALPYGGRYPCGSLVHNGIWYYGTYCLGPSSSVKHEGTEYNWPWLGPFVGFRISKDFGHTWTESPRTPADPLFGEHALEGQPVRIGAPHFVDFGQNMAHSPDGMAYLVAHGAHEPDSLPRFANASWITGDEIYLIRVKPSPETMNDASAYEFFGGHDAAGNPVWTKDFSRIEPLLSWNNHAGCVTMTYNAPLGRYLMCITDGWPTTADMDTYVLESEHITGPWKLVSYMESFGEQGYFVNIPSKFISNDGRRAWLSYSGNFTQNRKINPPGGRYGWVLQEILLNRPGEK